jgi:hypothetical protein
MKNSYIDRIGSSISHVVSSPEYRERVYEFVILNS